jgi:uncharacterized membrane protein YjgN (DUF898 family)
LGIYSAWAKVRSHRYFYSHLYIDGSNFEYVANPRSILAGRIVAVILFISYNIISRYLPDFSMWFLLVLVPIGPWIIYQSLKFRAHNSIFRNIRFGFHGSYKKALLVLGIYPAIAIAPFIILTYFTADQESSQSPMFVGLGMLFASIFSFIVFGFVLHQFYAFVVNNSSYGKTRFTFSSSVKEYLGLLTKVFFSFFGMIILLGIILAGIAGAGVALFGEEVVSGLSISFGVIFGMMIYVWSISMYAAGTTNRLYNGLLIPAWYTFRSDVTTWGFFKVYFINTILIVLTVGLYISFAKIRMVRYRIDHLKFVSTLNLDEFAFDSNEEESAVGHEVGEMFDMGLSL